MIKIINIINIIHYGIVTLRFAPISDEEYMHISLETWRSRRRGARGAGGLGGAREEETAEEEQLQQQHEQRDAGEDGLARVSVGFG